MGPSPKTGWYRSNWGLPLAGWAGRRPVSPRSENHKGGGTLQLNGRAFQAEETVSTKPRDGHELGVF